MNWKDITIGKYQELLSIQQGVYEFGIEKEIALLSCLTGSDVGALEALAKDKLIELSKVTNFVKEPMSEALSSWIKVGGKVFNVQLKAEKITQEQFILLNRYTANEANTIDNLHYILAVLTNERQYWWSTAVHRFDHNFEAKAELFREKLSIEVALPISVFFFKVYQSWLGATETYLLEKMKRIEAQARKELKAMEKR